MDEDFDVTVWTDLDERSAHELLDAFDSSTRVAVVRSLDGDPLTTVLLLSVAREGARMVLGVIQAVMERGRQTRVETKTFQASGLTAAEMERLAKALAQIELEVEARPEDEPS